MDGWNTSFFPFGMAYFQGLLLLVSGSVGDGSRNRKQVDDPSCYASNGSQVMFEVKRFRKLGETPTMNV